MNYLKYINTKIGTDSAHSFSNGNVSPLTALPFASASFMLETRTDGEFLYYNPHDRVTTGVRLTHKLSPWISDHGNITVMPVSGSSADLSEKRRSGFRPEDAVMSPGYLKAEFLRYRSVIELSPSLRGCIANVSWVENHRPRRILIDTGKKYASINIDYKSGRISGYVCGPKAVKEYFIFDVDATLDAALTVATQGGNGSFEGENLRIAVGVSDSAPLKAEIRFMTSFISLAQAELNLNRELSGQTVSSLRENAENEWNTLLSKIEIEADEDIKKTFYSCMWRVFLFPHTFHELDADGKTVHANPILGEIFEGPLYTDSCLWDTFRTTFPLFSIILRERYAHICEGFLNFYRECGWLPRITAPHPADCMPGTAIDAIFADAVVKGVVTDRATIEAMLEGMMKHANVTNSEPSLGGRDGIADYKKYHYLPLSYRESVNKTQDYAYGDFCISVIADHLGLDDVAEEYRERSRYYENLFDSETKLMKPRDRDGNFRTPWDQFNWGVDYTEGSAWQNSFSAFHDMDGLASLMGGKKELIGMMDRLFATPPYYNCGEPNTYPSEIHEMTEMAAVDFGQCALSNQPSFHIPFIYSAMGEPDKTCYWVRRAVRELFSSSEDGFPGDEDTGSMGAWYIFAALGLYPLCPSVGEYVLASPSVDRAVIHLENGNDLEIVCHGQGSENVYVTSVSQNGRSISSSYITHDSIMSGGSVSFSLSHLPSGRVLDDTPFSLRKI